VNLTAKSRYALKIMMDLAAHETEGPQQRAKIAARQGVPLEFMDQILSRLREKSLLVSTRGRHGGVALKRPPDTINLWDIFTAVEEDRFFPVRCVTETSPMRCANESHCISSDAWTEVYSELHHVLETKTLAYLLTRWEAHSPPPVDAPSPMTCRGSAPDRREETQL
jgi:Rrf2 family protein